MARVQNFKRIIPIAGKSGVMEYADMLIRRMQMIINGEMRYPEQSTGELVGGFYTEGDETGISIYNSAPHAKWVDKGAPPHMISGKRGNKLAWERYGQWNTAWVVSHPGIANPMRFSERAVEETKYAIKEIMRNKINQMMR